MTKSTSDAAPVTEDFTIARGIITRIGVRFPAAADDTTYVRLEYHGQRIFPYNRDGYYIGDGDGPYIHDRIPVLEPPYILRATGYNTASGADITVQIYVTVIPEEGFGG